MNIKEMKPVKLHGKERAGYYVCPRGDVWSNKRNSLARLATHIGGGNAYPRINIYDNGKCISTYVHRIVCESFHKFPKPEGVSKDDWKNTPESVKNLLNSLYQVNHIDHNHVNYHPTNLEWVTAKQNADKYQEHRTSK